MRHWNFCLHCSTSLRPPRYFAEHYWNSSTVGKLRYDCDFTKLSYVTHLEWNNMLFTSNESSTCFLVIPRFPKRDVKLMCYLGKHCVWWKDDLITLQNQACLGSLCLYGLILLSASKPAYKHIGESKYHAIDSFVSTKWHWNVKSSKEKLQKRHLRLNLLQLKCFSITQNFLDWYEILATQTRLICATSLEKMIRKIHKMKKKLAAKVHYNPKLSRFWIANCSQTLKITWIEINFLPQ